MFIIKLMGRGKKFLGLQGWRQKKSFSSSSSSSSDQETYGTPPEQEQFDQASESGASPWDALGETGWTKSIEQDLPVLRALGLYIIYSETGKLGTGMQAMVFRGRYGPELDGIGGIRRGMDFAVKIVDFSKDMVFEGQMQSVRTGDSGELQEGIENEKFIVTQTRHPNIVQVKLIINMGEQRILSFTDAPDNAYICSERVYIFMEFADGGTLESWLQDHEKELDATLKILLVQDLFRGVVYLHSNNIAHNDIHSKNVLMFSGQLSGNNRWTAKYVDFGCGYVSAKGKQYIYKPPIPQHEFDEKLRGDIRRMAFVMEAIIWAPNWVTHSADEMHLIEAFKRMIEEIKTDRPYDIFAIYNKYRTVL